LERQNIVLVLSLRESTAVLTIRYESYGSICGYDGYDGTMDTVAGYDGTKDYKSYDGTKDYEGYDSK